ncbi:hypothetical protein K9M48_05050 [Candidatus Gracilibacteria bacterium]|nr:hypothetical protein [Candidatus Gracilibacteria bacterium]
MKKGNVFYLVVIVLLFIFLWIPYFQNVAMPVQVYFLVGAAKDFVAVYPWILFLGIIEGVFITLYVKSFIDDMKQQDIKKFDL